MTNRQKNKADHPFSMLPLVQDEVRTFVDVGAFVGHYTYLALKRYPFVHVIAFEPTPASADELERNHGSSWRVTLHRAAVSDQAGEGSLHMTNMGAPNSLNPQTAEHHRQNPHVHYAGTHTVPIVTLDKTLPDNLDILTS